MLLNNKSMTEIAETRAHSVFFHSLVHLSSVSHSLSMLLRMRNERNGQWGGRSVSFICKRWRSIERARPESKKRQLNKTKRQFKASKKIHFSHLLAPSSVFGSVVVFSDTFFFMRTFTQTKSTVSFSVELLLVDLFFSSFSVGSEQRKKSKLNQKQYVLSHASLASGPSVFFFS